MIKAKNKIYQLTIADLTEFALKVGLNPDDLVVTPIAKHSHFMYYILDKYEWNVIAIFNDRYPFFILKKETSKFPKGYILKPTSIESWSALFVKELFKDV